MDTHIIRIAEGAFQCLMAQSGLGQHTWSLSEEAIREIYKASEVPVSNCCGWLMVISSVGTSPSSSSTPVSE